MAIAGQRPDIELKISQIADRMVPGKSAKEDRSIFLSKIGAAFAIVGSTLTSVGLSNPLIAMASGKDNQSISEVFGAFYGLPKVLSFVGVGIFILTALALAYYKSAKIDEKAVHSLALADAFERLEIQFYSDLEQLEPIEQLNVILNSAKTLESNYYKIMPKRDALEPKITEYARKVISKYSSSWGNVAPGFERRER